MMRIVDAHTVYDKDILPTNCKYVSVSTSMCNLSKSTADRVLYDDTMLLTCSSTIVDVFILLIEEVSRMVDPLHALIQA